MADPTYQYEQPAAPGNSGARAYPSGDGVREDEDRGFADLLRQLRDESTALFRQEIALAKTEIIEKAKTVARQAAMVAAGGVIALLGVVFVLWCVTGVIAWLLAALGVSAVWAAILAPLISGMLLLLTGGFLLMSGIEKLKTMKYTPEKTTQSLKEDKEWIQNKVA